MFGQGERNGLAVDFESGVTFITGGYAGHGEKDRYLDVGIAQTEMKSVKRINCGK